MPRGGKRPGAGRPKGSRSPATIKRKEIAERALAEGITPLEVMLRTMRDHFAAGRLDQASAVAKDAAPYMHPRLAAVEHSGPGGGPIEHKDVSYRDVLADRLARIAARRGARAPDREPDGSAS